MGGSKSRKRNKRNKRNKRYKRCKDSKKRNKAKNKKEAGNKKGVAMAISFTPFDELFAHDYQQTYINSGGGDIRVGQYTYNVFKAYTNKERQKAFQVCKKQLPWEKSEIQEEWELCMYMYQWIIKSPPPFPYQEYTLSGEIVMSDYHLLTQNVESKSVSVVFHIAIPSTGENAAGISWQDAVVLEQGGSENIVSVLPGITTQEDTQLKSGALIEKRKTVRYSGIGIVPAQKKAEIEAEFNSLKASVVADKQVILEWIGYQANVV